MKQKTKIVRVEKVAEPRGRTTANGAQAVSNFPWVPILDYVFVADYGQPDTSAGGLFLGNFDFGGYRYDQWRYGEVIGIGPGRPNSKGVRKPMPEISLGDIILFSRKHGTRLPSELRYVHPTIKSKEGFLIRVLDPEKTQAVLTDFVPWWDVGKRQSVNPGADFSG